MTTFDLIFYYLNSGTGGLDVDLIYVETTGETYSVVHKVSFILFEKTALVILVEIIALVDLKIGRMIGRNKPKRNA